MFKKTKIAAALLAVAAGSAQAVNVNPEGTGQVLIFPYYNTNNNFVTAISITNTTNLYKAVKVRFRESEDSNDVLDFNVYMSPFDVWTATVRNNPTTNVANIVTTDETCTYPDKAALQAGQDFIDVYSNVDSADLSEGYIEVIEMGVLADGPGPAIDDGAGGANGVWAETGEDGTADGDPNTTTTLADAVSETNIVYNIDHNTTGVPRNCGVITTAWDRDNGGATAAAGFSTGALTARTGNLLATTGGVAMDGDDDGPYLFDTINNGLVAPTGGLTGFAILLDLTSGAAFVEDPTVIDNYATHAQHFRPNDAGSDTLVGGFPIAAGNFLLPSLASGNIRYSVIPEALQDGLDSAADGNGAGALGVSATAQGVTDSTIVVWPLTHADTGSLLADTFFDGGSRVLQNAGANPFPIAAILSVTDLSNTYLIDEAIGAQTDWIITMPMKKHGVYTGRTFDSTNAAHSAVPAFTPVNAQKFIAINPDAEGDLQWIWNANNPGDAVVNLAGYYDNEEQIPGAAAVNTGFSPSLPGQVNATVLGREVNVLSFSTGTSTSLLGSPNATTYTLANGFVNGWAKVAFAATYDYNASAQLNALIAGDAGANENPADAATDDIDSETLAQAIANTTATDGTAANVGSGNMSYRGVPAIGFAAIAANGTTGKAGETVPHTRWQDRK